MSGWLAGWLACNDACGVDVVYTSTTSGDGEAWKGRKRQGKARKRQGKAKERQGGTVEQQRP